MNTIVFQSVPPVVEEAKNKDPNLRVDGSSIIISDLTRALLRYGSEERYFFLCDSPHSIESARRALSAYPHAERGEIVPIDGFDRFATEEKLILQISNIFMFGLSHLRRAFGGRKWPVLGLTHTLSRQDFPALGLVGLATLFESFRPYDCLICTSRAGQAAFEKIRKGIQDALSEQFGISVPHAGRYAVIPLGIDVGSYQTIERSEARRALGIPDDRTLFLFFGRLSPETKTDLFPLILSFSQLVREQQDLKRVAPMLALSGDDSESMIAPVLREFAASLGLADFVIIEPNPDQSTKRRFYAAADAFVSPSDNVQETFGITILEAMASGLPIIASDWNGYRETVEEGETGFLIPSYWASGVDYVSRLAIIRNDNATHWMLNQCVTVDPRELLRSMSVLAVNPERRRAMGKEARRRAFERYDWRVIIRQYEDLWEELLTQAAGQAEEQTGFRYHFSSYDYLSAFGHYATKILPLDSKVRLSSLGQNYLRGEIKIFPLEIDVGLLTAEATRSIAGAAAAAESCAWGELADRASHQLQRPIELMRHHTARLIKYGILELV